jgi:hypothetical protein
MANLRVYWDYLLRRRLQKLMPSMHVTYYTDVCGHLKVSLATYLHCEQSIYQKKRALLRNEEEDNSHCS